MTDSSAADAALRHLAEVVGPRGSSTPKVREAAEYAWEVLRLVDGEPGRPIRD